MSSTGYSGTPLPRKLGIKPRHTVAFIGAPPAFPAALGALPPDVRVRKQARAPLDVVVLFVRRRSELARRFPRLAEALAPTGGLWVAWPKRASGVETDLSFLTVQSIGLDSGLVDNKVCAIDDVWSGVRFVVRLENR